MERRIQVQHIQFNKMAKGKSSAAKGSNKRIKKLLTTNASGVTKGAIKRLARRAGVKRISALTYEEVRGSIKSFAEHDPGRDGVHREREAQDRDGR